MLVSVAVWVALVTVTGVAHAAQTEASTPKKVHALSATIPKLHVRPKLLVIGDSFSAGPDVPGKANNNVVGSERRGWWSWLASDLRYRPIISAEPGSGFLKNGLECAGTVFADRLKRLLTVRPDLLVIEGGRNDFNYCVTRISRATGAPVTTYDTVHSDRAAIQVAMSNYFDQVKKMAKQIGLPDDHIYVTMPWGGSVLDRRPMINQALTLASRQAGFQYVEIPPLTSAERFDITHPNALGSKRIFEHFVGNSDVERWRAHS
jgi:GDSL-like lipase/acylhydrolase family protein